MPQSSQRPKWPTYSVLILTAVAWALTVGYVAVNDGVGDAIFSLLYLPIEETIVLGRTIGDGAWIFSAILGGHLVASLLYLWRFRHWRKENRDREGLVARDPSP